MDFTEFSNQKIVIILQWRQIWKYLELYNQQYMNQLKFLPLQHNSEA